MSKSLSQLRSQLQVELRDPNDKMWTSPTKNQYINSAYFQIQKDNNFNWRECRTSTTLSSPHAIPSDFVMAEAVTHSQSNIILADKVYLRKHGYDLSETGSTATYYYYDGSNIKTYPVTTYDLTLDYKKKLSALTSDSDTIDFPDDFADAIVKYAKYLAWSSPRGNQDSAAEALSDYGQVLTTLIGSYGLQDINSLSFGMQNNLNNVIGNNVLY